MFLQKSIAEIIAPHEENGGQAWFGREKQALGLRLASIGIENEIYYGKFCCVAVRARPCDVSGQLYLASVLWLS